MTERYVFTKTETPSPLALEKRYLAPFEQCIDPFGKPGKRTSCCFQFIKEGGKKLCREKKGGCCSKGQQRRASQGNNMTSYSMSPIQERERKPTGDDVPYH
ncbi:hypothetical protein NPIL_429401 [Nephila pilipes]|uniref:Uncharacterized protein n=1 Tax=Nephila pilipes TaxID=299642 RepID=A0A8X6UGP9_NEPPI|nr:hypothetical protein NPIL_429401 [Nephila pilipes]